MNKARILQSFTRNYDENVTTEINNNTQRYTTDYVTTATPDDCSSSHIQRLFNYPETTASGLGFQRYLMNIIKRLDEEDYGNGSQPKSKCAPLYVLCFSGFTFDVTASVSGPPSTDRRVCVGLDQTLPVVPDPEVKPNPNPNSHARNSANYDFDSLGKFLLAAHALGSRF